jgi:ribonucleotide reductase beta subunit family protein with ferritin-like domain
LKGDLGGGSVKAIFMIGLMVSALYAGYMFAMPFYKHNAMSSEAKQIARLGQDKAKTLELINEKVQELDVPVKKEQIDVSIDREKKIVTIKMAWSVNVDLMGFYNKTLFFKIDVKQ